MTDKTSSNELAFRASLAGRAGMTILALCIIVALPLMYEMGMFATRRYGNGLSDETWCLFVLVELMTIAIGLPIIYVAGPNDLSFNLKERTYRQIYGWFFAPKVQVGSIDDDIAGVYVYCRYMNRDYQVGLSWKSDWQPGRKWFFVLGRFDRSGRADLLAAETAATLALPLVEPPAPFKSSTSLRDG